MIDFDLYMYALQAANNSKLHTVTHLRSTVLKDSAAVFTTLKDNGRNFSMAARIPSEPKSISERNLRPTLKRASRGQGWNQSKGR